MNTIVGATVPVASHSERGEESRILMIKDFIYYSSKPFTSTQIVAELGICYETVKKYLPELVKSEYIKLIGKDKGKNVYIYNKHKNTDKPYKVNQKHYTLESVQEAYRRQIQKKRELFDDLL